MIYCSSPRHMPYRNELSDFICRICLSSFCARCEAWAQAEVDPALHGLCVGCGEAERRAEECGRDTEPAPPPLTVRTPSTPAPREDHAS